jgi:hypothetical protein
MGRWGREAFDGKLRGDVVLFILLVDEGDGAVRPFPESSLRDSVLCQPRGLTRWFPSTEVAHC